MVDSIGELKLHGLGFDFAGMTFRTLTDLRLQDVSFESKIKAEELLMSLSSALQLYEIRLIFIATLGDVVISTSAYKFPVLLSSLRVLYLEDLYQDLLNLVLESIKPGSYYVVLSPTRKCLQIIHPGGPETVGLYGLRAQATRVNTMMLTPHLGFPGQDICAFLELFPNLTTLSIDSSRLNSNYLTQFIRPADSNTIFPKIAKLTISSCSIATESLTVLQEVIASYPIEVLGLGLTVTWSLSGMNYSQNVLSIYPLTNPIRDWLSNTVPKIIWIHNSAPLIFDLPS
ncbi:unnamed protein product [Rhizoctonia solani]|uniref:Uncharacterized protein n=1 Tax=Rhizoctonia solani TaxID=456999 RepID=A0A8H2W8N1_9AGAM|nr:unnamed protein product [Rhizoctonia solani]